MLVSPLAVVPPLIQGGVQLVVGIYREVAPTHIIKKANGKYDEGIDVLEEYHPFMTPDQIQEIANMAQRVEAARPPYPSGSTTLLDLLRNPFNKVNVARKYKRVCKEYLHLVQRTSQLARVKAAERDVLFAWGEKNGMLSQTLGPMIEASDGSGIPTARIIDVSRAVALEIERAAGPGAEMSVKFCDVKLSVGAKTSISLQFTPAGIVTVNLGLIELPSLVQRGEGVAPEHGGPAESGQGEVAVEEGNAPHLTTPQINALARNPSVISMSGTATIFPRQKDRGDPNRGDLEGTKKKGDAVNKTNVHGEDVGGKVAYGLRFDNLEYRTEVDATLTKDESAAV